MEGTTPEASTWCLQQPHGSQLQSSNGPTAACLTVCHRLAAPHLYKHARHICGWHGPAPSPIMQDTRSGTQAVKRTAQQMCWTTAAPAGCRGIKMARQTKVGAKLGLTRTHCSVSRRGPLQPARQHSAPYAALGSWMTNPALMLMSRLTMITGWWSCSV